MIEFKQIIGRGTRLFDGKDYFTIYDFVKAHHHFSDPEWDGEPIGAGTVSKVRRASLCVRSEAAGAVPGLRQESVRMSERAMPDMRPASMRLQEKGQGEAGRRQGAQHPAHDGDDVLASRRHADVRPAVHGNAVWQAAGVFPETKPNCAPLWSAPDTRAKLLQGLAEKGFGHDQLAEMQKIIDAEKSDLFDVLAHVAYALPPVTREVRAENAQVLYQFPIQCQTAGLP